MPIEAERLQVAVSGSGFGDVAGGLDTVGDSALSARSSLGKLSKVAAGASAALGGLAAAGFGAAVQAAADFETAMVEVEKVTNPETAEKMSDSVRELAQTIPLAQEELAGITADAARFGVRGPKNIENFTESVAKMATATDLSTDQAGEALAKLTELTGTPISKVENLGSAINALSNNFATSSQEIVDSMMRSSAALSQLGMSQTDIAGLSAAINAVSESSERAGTRMRRLAQELMDPKKIGDLASAFGKTESEFRAMVKNDPTGTIKQMAQSMSQGGEQADALKNALSTVSRQALGALGQNLDGVNRALDTSAQSFKENTSLQEEFTASSQTFQNQLQLVRNRLRNVAITVGNALLPGLTSMLERVQPLITRVEEFASGLSKAQIRAASMQSSIMAVTGSIAYFVPQVRAAMLAFQALSAVLVTHREEITSTLMPVYEAIVDEIASIKVAASDLGRAFRRAFGPVYAAFDRLEARVTGASEGVSSSVQSTLVGGVRSAGQQVRNALNRLTQYFQTNAADIQVELIHLQKDIEDAWGNAMEQAEAAVLPALGRIEGLWDQHGREIRQSVTGLFSYVKNHPQQALSSLVSRVNPILGALVTGVRTNFAKIKQEVTQTLGAVRLTVRTGMLAVKRQILGPLSDSESQTSQTLGEMKTEFRQTSAMITDIVSRMTSTILSHVGPFLRDMLAIWRQHFTGPDGIVANARSAFNAIWGNVIKPILDTIQAAWRIFGDDLIRILDGVLGTLTTAIEIGFDAILTTVNVTLDLLSGNWGEAWDTMAGFAERTIQRVAQWMGSSGKKLISGAVGLIISAIKLPFERLYDYLIGGSLIPRMLGEMHQRFVQFFTNTKQRLAAWIGGLQNRLGSFFQNALGLAGRKLKAIHDRFGQAFSNIKDRLFAWARGMGNRLGSLLSGMASRARGWVSNFTRPFRKAKDRVLSEFGDLKDKLVGSSIVPDMLSMTIEEADDWKDPFLDPFRSAKSRVLGEFKDLKDKVSEARSASSQRSMTDRYVEQAKKAKKTGNFDLINSDLAYRVAKKHGFKTHENGDRMHEAEYINEMYDSLPGLDTGGYIEKAGVAKLHAGETVVPEPATVERAASTGGGGSRKRPIVIDVGTINASSYADGRAAMDGLLDEADAILR